MAAIASASTATTCPPKAIQPALPARFGAVRGYLSNIFEYASEDESITRNPCRATPVGAPKPSEKPDSPVASTGRQ
jgi:hypothetical protein